MFPLHLSPLYATGYGITSAFLVFRTESRVPSPYFGGIMETLSHCGIVIMSDSHNLSPPPATEGAIETVQFAKPKNPSAAATKLLSTGTRMGHYVIKKYVGGGGMGQVYRATDEALDRDVAIKVLTQQRATDQSTVARFLNEARSAARLNHEHIAQVYFAGETSGIPFIAFEYVEGINVRTMV